jgi:hypothetical protein
VDAPGEFYERPHQVDRRVSGEMDILDYLSSCHGIIFLLDPDRISETLSDDEDDYHTMLLDLMFEFQERNLKSGLSDDLRLEQYMAFCVTKVDKSGYWEQKDIPQNLAEDVMGNTMFRMLGANFCKPNRFNFFSSSAIGRYQDPQSGDWVENVEYPYQKLRPQQPAKNGNLPPIVSTMSIGEAFEFDPEPEPELEPAANPRPQRGSTRSSWAPASPTPTQPQKESAEPVKIIHKRSIAPYNVMEPLDWLIESIRRQPPRIMPKRQP